MLQKFPSVFFVALLFLTLAFSLALAQTQVPVAPSPQRQGPFVSPPVTPHVINIDLRTLPLIAPWQPGDPVREIPRRVVPRPGPEDHRPQPARWSPDPLLALQANAPAQVMGGDFATPTLNFEGTPFTGVRPPDTVGDVGLNHYIQIVNGSGGTPVAIYDKAGNLIAGPFDLDSLWSGGGACASGLGDPIVLYDTLADRWLLSEFATSGSHLCVYISQTPDPVSGGWYGYDFTTPNFPDYPKYAVWPDAYYVSSNENNPAAYALDRSQMLLGLPATSQRFTAPSLAGFPFQALTPGDLDGSTPPPAGSPGYFMRHRDDEVHDGSPNPTADYLEIWEFHVDWSTPANSTFQKVLDLPVTEFDSDLCGLSSFFCFPQPGTSTTLDPLREVIMWRLQYRNFGDHETLVGNLVTDVDGTDHGGIRWFELRKTGSNPWSLFQEGTFAPDAAHRWMGSVAMDGGGNIALGYSVSDAISIYPSIRYVGRLAGDPPGALPQGEYTIIAGSGFQSPSTRWGDYSAMSVDPADDCTFWYTNEYMPASGNWRTRIAAFKFPQCSKPDFELEATPETQELCTPGSLTYTVQVNQVLTYPYPVSLALGAAPVGVTADLTPTLVVPDGQATLTLMGTLSASLGAHVQFITGTAQLINVHTLQVPYTVNTTPTAPALSTPADGATVDTLAPTLAWQLTPPAASYDLQVAADPTFASPLFTATGVLTDHYTLPGALDPLGHYYWRVRGGNTCGSSAFSPAWSFDTPQWPCLLLVDDDGGESAEAAYTAALDALGVDYHLHTVAGSNADGPAAATLVQYPIVVWLTGERYVNTLTAADRSALSAYLDGGGSLFLSSWGAGAELNASPFLAAYLHADYTGDGPWGVTVPLTPSGFLSGLPVSVAIPIAQPASELGPLGGAETVYSLPAPDGSTAIAYQGSHQVVYLGFGFEWVANSAERQALMEAVLDWLGPCAAPPPTPGFSSSSPDLVGATTVFTNTTTGVQPITYTWSFGEGQPSAVSRQPSVTHTYSAVGVYTVWLTATNAGGTASISGAVEITGTPPVAAFVHSAPVTLGAAVVFTNTTTLGQPAETTYTWNWGDGQPSVVSSQPSVTHTYPAVGAYTAWLTATNLAGSDAVSGTVHILAAGDEFWLYLPLVLK